MKPKHAYRILATRDCAHCKDKDAVIISTRIMKSRRSTMRFCSRRCSRQGTGCSPQRRQKALNLSVALMAEASTQGQTAFETAAKAIYHRGYHAGAMVGVRLGEAKERRRLVRLAIAARKARAA